MMAGSPGFQAPEQLRAESLGPHCDVYAFGCVLITLFREQTLWPGLTPFQILCKVSVNNEVPNMENLDPSIKSVCTLALQEMSKRPNIHSILQSLLKNCKYSH